MKTAKPAPLSVIRQSLELSGSCFLPYPDSSSSCHHDTGLIQGSRVWGGSAEATQLLRWAECHQWGPQSSPSQALKGTPYVVKQALWPSGKETRES